MASKDFAVNQIAAPCIQQAHLHLQYGATVGALSYLVIALNTFSCTTFAFISIFVTVFMLVTIAIAGANVLLLSTETVTDSRNLYIPKNEGFCPQTTGKVG